MKLRLNHQSLRLRLSENDLKTLASVGEVRESLNFDSKSQLNYSLLLNEECEKLTAHLEGPHIQVLLPKKMGEKWLHSQEISLKDTNDSLKILVEKDLPCDHRGKETSYD